MKELSVVPADRIEQRILLVRGLKVMLDSDLAALYEVETFNLNKAVKRNITRFPPDFMFQLSAEENRGLTFQNGISSPRHGGRRHLPYVFTEQGIAMLSSVLRSPRAVAVNIAIMRAFVKLREMLAANNDLALRLVAIERKMAMHDVAIRGVVETIQRLTALPEPPDEEPAKESMGFRPNKT